MANAEDLDSTIDGFDPDDFKYSNPRLRQQRYAQAPAYEQPAYAQPAPTGEAAAADPEPARQPEEAPVRPRRQSKKQRRPDPVTDEPRYSLADSPIVRFFTDERLRLALGIFMILMCVFILIAFVSHYRNSVFDQSHVMNSTLAEIAEHPGSVKNVGGGFGAWVSHVMLCDSLGVGSLAFIVYAWLLGLALLGFKKVNFWSLTFKTLLVAVTASIVVGLVTYNSYSALRWGGTHGLFVNSFLIDHTTVLGAILVSIFLVSCVVCVYINELRSALTKWKESSNRRKLQEELRRERQRLVDKISDVANTEIRSKKKTKAAQEQAVDVDSAADKTGATIADTFSHAGPEEGDATDAAHAAAKGNADHIFDTDAPDAMKKSDGGFSLIAAPESEAETPAAEPAEAPKTEPTAEGTADDGAFSIVAPEIEKAAAFEIAEPGVIVEEEVDEAVDLYDPHADLPNFHFPTVDLLTDRQSGPVIDMEEQQANKERIVKTLLDYKIPVSKIEATVGPTVTLYEIVPAEGVRISQIKRLEDDIALSLAALGIRIIAPIPGKGTVGIEVPNRDPQTVSMRSIITSKKYQECKMALPMAMGATISNDIFVADLAKMPHLLVAGATGQGKSVGLNAIIASLLYKKHPSELKFVLVDPKMVEFSLYSKLERHYMAKLPDEDDSIITDPNKVILTLNSLCVEMDNRYALLRDANVRSLEEYNKKFTERRLNPKNGHKFLPYIVVIVDEFADLIMTAGKEVETPIARIAQKARAVGMHMIIATQRPSTNVITGIIKANFPGRIAFRVSQMVDSKTILDRTGANQLIGKGDMLFSHNGSMDRVQCAFISTEEVEAIVQSIDDQIGYEHAYYLPEFVPESAEGGAIAGASSEKDALFDEVARFVVQRQTGSTSSIQRQFGIGYNRAGRLMDQMEAAGIVGPVNGAKPRNILVDYMTLEHMLQQS